MLEGGGYGETVTSAEETAQIQHEDQLKPSPSNEG